MCIPKTHPLAPYAPDLVARFWSKVDIRETDECWPFLGSCHHRDGYGRFHPGGGKAGRRMQAHRFACIVADGPLDDGSSVRHTCDNPPCCNPKHLLPGTHADNMRDKKVRNRLPDQTGDRAPNRKLTAEQVREIKASGWTSTAYLADKFGVSKLAVTDVMKGKTWKATPAVAGLPARGEPASAGSDPSPGNDS